MKSRSSDSYILRTLRPLVGLLESSFGHLPTPESTFYRPLNHSFLIDQSLNGEDVVWVLNNIVAIRGKPITIKTNNGSEFISRVMDKWAYERGVELVFSQPGKPIDNAMVESLNRRLRQECLNEH
jgi:transposase InsO family protein